MATPLAVSPEMMLPDLLRSHPEVRPVFDRYGLRGCGGKLGPVESIHFFARSHGVEEARLLRELGDAIAHPESVAPSAASNLGDAIYRRYFLGGIVLILTAGATWGAYLLWQIGLGGAFTKASLHAVNAHGHAQIYGWVGLFIMGFSLQAFPRLWHTDLWRPKLAALAFALMALGLVTRTVGMTAAGAAYALPLALFGGCLEIAAITAYALIVWKTFTAGEARSSWRTQPYVGFAFAAVFYFVASIIMCVWHMWNTMTTAGAEQLWYVATYQAPLRDLQIHGLAMCMILAVSMRMLPALFEVPEISVRRGWLAFALINVSVVTEAVLFVAYRWTQNHALAALLLIPWLGLFAGTLVIVLPWKLWRPFKVDERSGKFVRASYAWLMISLLMLLLLPVYQYASGIAFSHAYYGATRHAITVGFISLMIMGFAAKVVPTLNGIDTSAQSKLWVPFVLVNVGCALRVVLQTLTDWNPVYFQFVGVSGVLEVSGLAIWGLGLARVMLAGATGEAENGPAPCEIRADHRVAQVLAWYPQTEEIFVASGFTLLKNPVLRRTVARQVTLSQACTLKHVAVEPFVAALNGVIKRQECDHSHGTCGQHTAA